MQPARSCAWTSATGTAVSEHRAGLHVADGERPTAEQIAARIDLEAASYHELCCKWSMWANDKSLYDDMPACDCGGPEMAKAYVQYARALHLIASGDQPPGLSGSAFADCIIKEQISL